MEKVGYVKPEIKIIFVQELLMNSASGTIDGVKEISDGGDAEYGMEAQSKGHSGYSLWDD